jgi:hypothetical protein
MNDIEILVNLDKRQYKDGEHFKLREYELQHFLTDGEVNHSGYKKLDLGRVHKLVSLGLLNKESSSKIDTVSSSLSIDRIKTTNTFQLTYYYDFLKTYIEENESISKKGEKE